MGQHHVCMADLIVPVRADTAFKVQGLQRPQQRVDGQAALADQYVNAVPAVSQPHIADIGPQGLDGGLHALPCVKEGTSHIPCHPQAHRSKAAQQQHGALRGGKGARSLKQDLNARFFGKAYGLLQ